MAELIKSNVNVTGNCNANSLIGLGTSLTSLTPPAITTFNNIVADRIITFENSTTIKCNTGLVYTDNNLTVIGTFRANNFSGNGSALTAIPLEVKTIGTFTPAEGDIGFNSSTHKHQKYISSTWSNIY